MVHVDGMGLDHIFMLKRAFDRQLKQAESSKREIIG